MARQFRHLTFALACAAALFGHLHAQAERPSERKLRFTVFAPEVPTGLAYVVSMKPEKFSSLVFFPSARSPAYEHVGAGPLQFVDETTREPVASVAVPPNVKEALLVFFPAPPQPGSTLRYHVYVHDDGETKYGAGGLAVLNFSGLTLNGTIDRQQVDVTEGDQGPFNVGLSAKVQLTTTFHERKLQSYAETITLGQDGRALLILLPPFRKGSIEVQTRVLLDEIVAEKKEEKPKR